MKDRNRMSPKCSKEKTEGFSSNSKEFEEDVMHRFRWATCHVFALEQGNYGPTTKPSYSDEQVTATRPVRFTHQSSTSATVRYFLRFCGESHLWLPRRILHVKWEVDQVTSQQRFFITALIMAILFNFLSVVEPDHWTHFNLKFLTKSVDQFYRSGDSKMWWTALTLLMIATMATRFYSLGHPTSVW